MNHKIGDVFAYEGALPLHAVKDKEDERVTTKFLVQLRDIGDTSVTLEVLKVTSGDPNWLGKTYSIDRSEFEGGEGREWSFTPVVSFTAANPEAQ
ncbi:MAG: hypothetical protein KA515_02080 [Candidatus Pacebacteria bacterium]|nr:hypothetical protein [Candidatus Paceibacterota bacterium]